MNVRQKLNIAYFNGSILLAALMGWLTQSWPVFFLTLAALLGLNLYLHQLRPQKPRTREVNRKREGASPLSQGEGNATK